MLIEEDINWVEAAAMLNSIEMNNENSSIAFEIVYWGAHHDHHDNPVHKHSFYEICYVVDGVGSYEEYKESHPLSSGTLFLSRPGISHQIKSDTGLLLWWVAFRVNEHKSEPSLREQYKGLDSNVEIVVGEAGDTPSVLLWRALYKQALERRFANDNTLKQTTEALLCSFPSVFTKEDNTTVHEASTIPIRHSTSSSLLHQARIFIMDNLSSELYLEDVASYLHVSGRHLSRLFSTELGVTYTEYVTRQRLSLAKHLLRTTDFPIRVIAGRCGFSSVHYFTKVFRAYTEESPGAYRKTNWKSESHPEGEHNGHSSR